MKKYSLVLRVFIFILCTQQSVSTKILAQPTDGLKILSLNAWGLPVNIPGSNQGKRFDLIVDSINHSEADILCLQECFSKRLRSKIYKNLKNGYKHFQDILESRRELLVFNMDKHGGLITLSKYPVIWEKFYAFPISEDMSPIEKLGRKGFLLSKIDTPEGIVLVVNTHLYAGNNLSAEKFRTEQIKYLYEVLSITDGFHQYPSFLVGDLNINHPETLTLNPKLIASVCFEYLSEHLGFFDTSCEAGKVGFTYDCTQNGYAEKKDGPQKLDYILFRPTAECVVDVISCDVRYGKSVKLSDHFGIEAKLALIKAKNNESQVIVNKLHGSENDQGISP